ncbi:unnamed protein product [Blepharisma stoltei]|uniref:C2 domain-containing protein n=1 Tax=Blepharisma stoltei TaxID=1481888 RepID=A0AAU9IKX6_9CILI|nr:unnamed protein product [Blepharisma stoltei]
MEKSGILYIKPISAKLVRDVEMLGIMSPYCEIKIDDQIFSTKVCESGGTNPHWSDEFIFKISGENHIKLTVIDRRTIKGDQEIGSATIPLENIFTTNILEDWIGIYHENENAGQIRIYMKFSPGSQEFPSKIGNIEPKLIGFEHEKETHPLHDFTLPPKHETKAQLEEFSGGLTDTDPLLKFERRKTD